MSAFLILIVCLLLGIVVAWVIKPSPMLAAALNWWVVNIALPALVLRAIAELQLRLDMWYLAASMWLVFGLAWIFFVVLGKLLHWPRDRIGALILVCGLGNTAFIGYAMIEALRGPQALAFAAVADQVGCFLMLAIGGALVTSIYGAAHARIRVADVVLRVLKFPPFIALVIGFVVGALGGWHTSINTLLGRVGDTLMPLALFSVGLQVRTRFPREQLSAASLGLAYKLFLAPLMIYALGRSLGVGGMTLTISVLQAAMAPMISAAILAEQNELEPRLANLVLVSGIILSLVSVPLINRLL